jgi:ATP adenylyltransferase
MIAPYRHLDTPDKLSSEEQLELFRSIAKSTTLLRHCMHPDGFNIGMNVGKMAGAGFEHHLHIHVVPRWNGDTNFMPVVANTKVIPEDLTVTYRKLATIFRQTLSEGEDDVH